VWCRDTEHARGEALIASGRARQVLSICVEVCSAAMYLDDDPGVLISACLFGDGAGAAVLTSEPVPGRRRIEWKSAGTLLNAVDRRTSCASSGGEACCATSSRTAVPALAARHVDEVLAEGLEREQSRARTLPGGFSHAGGREILAAIRQRVGLTEDQTRWSASVFARLRQCPASPCVYFVLETALNEEGARRPTVDVVVRGGHSVVTESFLRSSVRPAVSRRGHATTTQPEILDHLGPDDRRAIQARRDLARSTRSWSRRADHARALRAQRPMPRRIVELGAGDGSLLLRIATRLGRRRPACVPCSSIAHPRSAPARAPISAPSAGISSPMKPMCSTG
jgi:hypothetical protein